MYAEITQILFYLLHKILAIQSYIKQALYIARNQNHKKHSVNISMGYTSVSIYTVWY